MNEDKINYKAMEIFNKLKTYLNEINKNGEFSIEERQEVMLNITSNMFMICCLNYNDDNSINISNSTHNFIFLQEYMINHFKYCISQKRS